MKYGRRIVTTIGLVLFLALGLLSAPAGAAERGAAGIDRVPMSAALSGQTTVVGTTVGVLDASCPDYRLCVWDRRDYDGNKIIFSSGAQGQWLETTATIRSAKNRFGDRAVGFYNINTGERVRCMNPTTNLPGLFPDATRLLYIAGPGSRC